MTIHARKDDPFRRPRPLYVTCDGGLEGVLTKELEAMGIERIMPSHRGIGVVADRNTMHRIIVESRVANRVLVPVAEFPATARDALYEGAQRIAWERWFDVDKTISIDASCHKSEMSHTGFVAQVIKDGICDRFRGLTGRRPSVERNRPQIRINVRIDRDECVISLDASGERLHRRGYRKETGQAPLKETLAAGILKLSGWQAGEPLLDPMCGSGTFLVEAAMMAAQIPPGLARGRRRQFGFNHWVNFDTAPFDTYIARLETEVKTAAAPIIFGTDSDADMIAKTYRNAERAGVNDWIQLAVCAVENLNRPDKINADSSVAIVSNPPYGERLRKDALEETYAQLGLKLKSEFGGSSATVIISETAPYGAIGLSPTKSRRIRNGAIPCKLLSYDIFRKRA